MEREKTFLGWNCTLSPDEVEYSRGELVLQEYIEKWKSAPDGGASLRVSPLKPGSRQTMGLFIEGLGEGMFETVNVIPVGDIEIIEQEY